MTTRAPSPASPTAASFPIPVFPPVITTTLPAISVMTDNAIRGRPSDDRVPCESTCDHRDRPDRSAEENLTALRGRKIRHHEQRRVPPERKPLGPRLPAHRGARRHGRDYRLHVISPPPLV